MSKYLVARLSVGGATAKGAREIAAAKGADRFEIKPEEADLNLWKEGLKL